MRTIATSGRGGGGPQDQRWRIFGTYTIASYVNDPDGRELVDRIIRLEDIDWALPETLREIGIPVATDLSVPRVNERRHGSYATYYDDMTIEYVAKLYADDIARFGYEFNL